MQLSRTYLMLEVQPVIRHMFVAKPYAARSSKTGQFHDPGIA
jgi:hypothetical protein